MKCYNTRRGLKLPVCFFCRQKINSVGVCTMDPKYSVLLSGQSVNGYLDQIGSWLNQGIKVIWLAIALSIMDERKR